MRGIRLFHPMTLTRMAGALLAAALFALTPAAPAWAHNQLRSADPAPDATVATAPMQVVVEFTESLNPTFTSIVITDVGARRVPTTEPAVSGTRGSVTFTQPLGDGTYTVAYRVVSRDGHPVQGAYSFTVGHATNPSATPSAAAAFSGSSRAPTDDAAAGGGSTAGGATTMVAMVLGALIVAVAGGGWLLWRRREGRR